MNTKQHSGELRQWVSNIRRKYALKGLAIGLILYAAFTFVTGNELARELKEAQREVTEQRLVLAEGVSLEEAQKLKVAEAKEVVAVEEAALQDIQKGNEHIRKLIADLESKIDSIIHTKFIEDVHAAETGNFKPIAKGGIDEFLKANGASHVHEAGDAFRAAGLLYGVQPELLVCIAQADSSLGHALKTQNNIGNVGNDDSGNTWTPDTLEIGIAAIGSTLINQYMGGNTMLGELSQGGRTVLGGSVPCSKASAPNKCYASSEYNWNKNVKLCLQNILQDNTIDETFNYKTNG